MYLPAKPPVSHWHFPRNWATLKHRITIMSPFNSLSPQSWEIFHDFLSSTDFFQNQLFRKIISGLPSECKTIWIQIRPDVLLSLIWIQTVCIGYQQTTLLRRERVKPFLASSNFCCLLMFVCKQFWPRPGLTECRS